MGNSASTSLPPLVPVSHCVTERFIGPWFVQGVKPTVFETTCSNAVETYSRADPSKGYDINIDFKYNQKEPLTSALKSLPQKGWIQNNKEDSGFWKISPLWPLKFPYTIIEIDDKDYKYVVIGYPSRSYCWIMYRHPVMPEATYEMLTDRLVKKHQYSLEGLRRVPHVWTAEERAKRGLTEKEIPDSMLQSSESK